MHLTFPPLCVHQNYISDETFQTLFRPGCHVSWVLSVSSVNFLWWLFLNLKWKLRPCPDVCIGRIELHWQGGITSTESVLCVRMIKVQHIMHSFYWSLTHMRYDVMIVRSVLWFIASLISLAAIKFYLCVNLPLYILEQEEKFSWLVYDSVHSCPWRQTKNISSYKERLFSSWQWCWLLHSALKRGRITRAQYKSAHSQSSHLQPGWLSLSVFSPYTEWK